MAEGFLRHLGGDQFTSLSAGTAPLGLNPLAVAAMDELGLDIGGQTSDHITAYLEDLPNLVITVCDRAAETCPRFPAKTTVLAWSFEDPAAAQGSQEEVRQEFRRIRDNIRDRVRDWLRLEMEKEGTK